MRVNSGAGTTAVDAGTTGAAGSICVAGSVRMPRASPTTRPRPAPSATSTTTVTTARTARRVAVVMDSR